LGYTGNPVTSNDEWDPVYEIFDEVDMVLVPAGCFTMGSSRGYEEEQPAHEQCFDEPYWIDLYEVTNDQYGSTGEFGGANRPRERANWFDAVEFCESRGARLPTEPEWEYAARGPDGLNYPWGNSFDGSNVVYEDNSGDETSTVGSRPGGVSWVGAYDMSGNVWEWVSSTDDDYPYDPTDGRESDDDRESRHVLRGGSYRWDSSILRTAMRGWSLAYASDTDFGFRCVRDF
jgi:iron(II)-dependent oxidoreductase